MNIWSEIGRVSLTGILIVFGVLAIIYAALVLSAKIFAGKSKVTVTAPLNGVVESVLANASVEAGEAVLLLKSDSGRGELLSPVKGKIVLAVAEGESVKAGDKLFSVEEASVNA